MGTSKESCVKIFSRICGIALWNRRRDFLEPSIFFNSSLTLSSVRAVRERKEEKLKTYPWKNRLDCILAIFDCWLFMILQRSIGRRKNILIWKCDIYFCENDAKSRSEKGKRGEFAATRGRKRNRHDSASSSLKEAVNSFVFFNLIFTHFPHSSGPVLLFPHLQVAWISSCQHIQI